MECFIEWLIDHWLDRSTDEAISSWGRMTNADPQRTADQVDCIKRMAENPPPDLVAVMKQYGSINLYHVKKVQWIPYSHEEHVTWLKEMVQKFRAIAEDL